MVWTNSIALPYIGYPYEMMTIHFHQVFLNLHLNLVFELDVLFPTCNFNTSSFLWPSGIIKWNCISRTTYIWVFYRYWSKVQLKCHPCMIYAPYRRFVCCAVLMLYNPTFCDILLTFVVSHITSVEAWTSHFRDIIHIHLIMQHLISYLVSSDPCSLPASWQVDSHHAGGSATQSLTFSSASDMEMWDSVPEDSVETT